MKAVKFCKDELKVPLVGLINASLSGGVFPDGCKVAKVRPLFKVDAGEIVHGCYADLSKAFDCVDADTLIQKLNSLGIQNPELGWFSSYLRNRFQVVEIQHESKFNKIQNYR
ncbi:hypothetical protein J6590_011642 [Homalodisca vitripennis]|nr:hypothetical protein J6590_011642 [Homalodisca vitripennis]